VLGFGLPSTYSDPHLLAETQQTLLGVQVLEKAQPSHSAWEAQMSTRASLQSFLAGSDLKEREGKKKFENTLSPFREVCWK